MNIIYFTVKSLNNNLVLAVNKDDEEFVLFGKGIGFNKKQGDPIQADLVEKIFHTNENQNLSVIISHLSTEILSLSEQIVQFAEKNLDTSLNTSLVISLADHLQSAVERSQTETSLDGSTLQWEIPFLYHREYQLAQQALQMIYADTGVELPKEEAAFIALHFVNAQNGISAMNETMLITQITKDIVKTIQTLFKISLDKESVHYARFVIHIRCLINRQLHPVVVKSMDGNLFEIIQQQYPQSYACCLVIRELLKDKYNMNITNDEMMYLMIHIERVIN